MPSKSNPIQYGNLGRKIHESRLLSLVQKLRISAWVYYFFWAFSESWSFNEPIQARSMCSSLQPNRFPKCHRELLWYHLCRLLSDQRYWKVILPRSWRWWCHSFQWSDWFKRSEAWYNERQNSDIIYHGTNRTDRNKGWNYLKKCLCGN